MGLHVFLESLWKNTKEPVSLTALTPNMGESDGTNSFSLSRFHIPELCNWSGWAIFADGIDMLLRADLADLWKLRDPKYALQCVKHDYQTKSPRKYLGTDLEADNQDYPRKNWSSLVLWNCGHWAHFKNRESLRTESGKYLHRFSWLKDEEIGELPTSWNHLVGESEYNPEAKLAHYTLGIPGFEHYRRADYAKEWTETLKAAASGLQYLSR